MSDTKSAEDQSPPAPVEWFVELDGVLTSFGSEDEAWAWATEQTINRRRVSYHIARKDAQK
jgi:hypothetical protein